MVAFTNLLVDRSDQMEVRVKKGSRGGEQRTMKELQILVVEDDSLIAMLLVETLAELGHCVCAVEATEAGAVTAALRCRPDLIIVDAQLIGGSGVSAIDEIIRNGFVPHLFISGDIKKIMELKPGAVAIEKPFHEPELVRAIHRALGPVDNDHKNRAK
jgi:CheY-like chemotaxis protein